MKFLMMLAGFVGIHSPAFFMRKRERLAHRLRWINYIDGLEASLESAARTVYDGQTGRRI